MSDTVKLIIEIPKSALELLNTTGVDWLDAEHILSAVANGTPFDSVIEDIKTEVFRQSEQNNENFSHDWNEGFNDGMFHTLTIIRECFKHISGKEN